MALTVIFFYQIKRPLDVYILRGIKGHHAISGIENMSKEWLSIFIKF